MISWSPANSSVPPAPLLYADLTTPFAVGTAGALRVDTFTTTVNFDAAGTTLPPGLTVNLEQGLIGDAGDVLHFPISG